MADTQTPTVNSQITDAVTQTNVTVVGEAPAQSMAMVYQSMAHATSLLMQNSVMAQGGMQQINSAVVASACQRIMTLPGQNAAAPQPPQNPSAGQFTGQAPGGQPSGGQPPGGQPPGGEPLGGQSPGAGSKSAISPDQKRSLILKAANEAAKVAALASEATNHYNQAQEKAEDILANADPKNSQSIEDAKSSSATAHEAAKHSKMASQASQRADVLYGQIFDEANSENPDIDTIKNLLKQMTSHTAKAETARDKVKEHKNQIDSVAG